MIIKINNDKSKYYQTTTKSPEIDTKCSICNDNDNNDNDNNDTIQIIECLHEFHKKCIDEWFKTKKQCPLCLKYLDERDKDKKPIKKQQFIQNHIIYLRNRRLSSSASKEAIDVLLQSPKCNNNNSLFYFMPN